MEVPCPALRWTAPATLMGVTETNRPSSQPLHWEVLPRADHVRQLLTGRDTLLQKQARQYLVVWNRSLGWCPCFLFACRRICGFTQTVVLVDPGVSTCGRRNRCRVAPLQSAPKHTELSCYGLRWSCRDIWESRARQEDSTRSIWHQEARRRRPGRCAVLVSDARPTRNCLAVHVIK
jgi:hypothetical protein